MSWIDIICTENGREHKFTRQKSCLYQLLSAMAEDKREAIDYNYNVS